MNAIGFSKCEREIQIHHVHLRNALFNCFQTSDACAVAIAGSTSEGMCGGIYSDQIHYDFDMLFTTRKIKLCTPRTNNINNPPLSLLSGNEYYDAFFFIKEDNNFPGYVKLSLAEAKTKFVYLHHCTRMNDDKLYLSNSMIMNSFCKRLAQSLDNCIPLFSFRFMPKKKYINGPAHSVHGKDHSRYNRKADHVYCIHYDM